MGMKCGMASEFVKILTVLTYGCETWKNYKKEKTF
jgi:hypothetical protein